VGASEDTGEGIGGTFGTIVILDVSLRRRPIDNLCRKPSFTGVRRPSELDEIDSCAKALVRTCYFRRPKLRQELTLSQFAFGIVTLAN
jgi:hypothetical protein